MRIFRNNFVTVGLGYECAVLTEVIVISSHHFLSTSFINGSNGISGDSCFNYTSNSYYQHIVG